MVTGEEIFFTLMGVSALLLISCYVYWKCPPHRENEVLINPNNTLDYGTL
jgi:hypothetical protein